jgi:3-oxoacyl-[acyl-carrier protein] reductase
MLQPYVKYLSKTLGEYGVRVNLISPGNILFDGGNWDNKLRLNKSEIEDYIKTNVPLNKFGTPSDIGNMVAFLVSEKSNFITGSNLVIDGGQTSAF